MDNLIILKAKKRVFKEAVQEVCDIQNLPLPEINFDGTDEDGGDELAHSHPELYKICISERQLKLQNSAGLKETAYHEMTHLIGLIEHGHQFEKTKNELISRGWRPPKGSGAQFISGEQVNEQSKQIRDDPERFAKVNEDSALLKFLEGRSNHDNESSIHAPEEIKQVREGEVKPEEEILKPTEIKAGKGSKKKGEKIRSNRSKAKYTPMTKAEIEEARRKIGMNAEDKSRFGSLKETNEEKEARLELEYQKFKQNLEAKLKQKQDKPESKPHTTKAKRDMLSEEEHENLIKKAYENMDTGFGEGHGNNRWSKKKKGVFSRFKEALGIK
jgi:hypothetical protein